MVCPEHGEKLVGAPVMAVGLGKWMEMDGNGEIQKFFQLTPFFFVELKKKKT